MSRRGIYARPKSIKPDINEAIEFVLIAVAKETIVWHRFFPLASLSVVVYLDRFT